MIGNKSYFIGGFGGFPTHVFLIKCSLTVTVNVSVFACMFSALDSVVLMLSGCFVFCLCISDLI